MSYKHLTQDQARAFYDAQQAAGRIQGAIIMEFPKKTAAAPCRIFLTPAYQVIIAGGVYQGEAESYPTLRAFAQAYELIEKENFDDLLG